MFEDAGKGAVERGIRQLMLNSGQSCNAPSRMIVHEAIYNQVVSAAAEIGNQISAGVDDQPGSHLGPVVNATRFEKIQ